MAEQLPCDIDELRSLFLFEKLSDEQLLWLCEHGAVEQWEPGMVFREDQPATCFFVLLSGEIALLRNVGGDFNSVDGGWNLQKLEFQAPGFSQVALSGKLAIKDNGTSFTGPAVIDATDPKLLFAWWQGREADPAGDLKPLHLRGDVTFGTPHWRGTGSVTYGSDNASFTARVRYVGGGEYNHLLNIANNDTSARVYVDLNAQVNVDERFTLFANVNNLFDRDPPLSPAGSIHYDSIGSYVTVGAKLRL